MIYRSAIEGETTPTPDEQIVTVATFQSLVEADLVRSELASAGIMSWISNATSTATFVGMPEVGLGIQVAESDAVAAKEIADRVLGPNTTSAAELDAAAMSASSVDTIPDSDVNLANRTGGTMYDDAEAGG